MLKYIKFLVSFLLFLAFLLGIYLTITDIYPNNCQMTYMFEYPQYVRLNVKNNSFKNYKLYIYGEGDYALKLQRKIFKGIPVLFIPGNQGSHKQVRSLASVAYQMSRNEQRFHFNFFSVDFNEEMGALDGSVLKDQIEFIVKAAKTIMNLYSNSRSIVLIGHSIGGLLARSVLTSPDSPSVSLIVTLAAPHSRPVVILDREVEQFYESIDKLWNQERYEKLKNVALITVGGGRNDILVPNVFTRSHFADIDVTLNSIPFIWLTTDHLAIVWCKQLVLSIVRSLYGSVDGQTLQIHHRKEHIIHSFSNNLLEKQEPFDMASTEDIPKLLREGEIHKVEGLFFSTRLRRAPKSNFVVISLDDKRDQKYFNVLVGPLQKTKLLFFASNVKLSNGSYTLSSTVSLMKNVRSLPKDMRMISVDSKFFENASFNQLLLYLEPQNDLVVEVEKRSSSSRRSISAPPFLSFKPVMVTRSTLPHTLTLNFKIRNFTEYWQSYFLTLTPVDDECQSTFQPIVSYVTEGMKAHSYPLNSRGSLLKYVLELDAPLPSESHYVSVFITKSSSCSFGVSFETNHLGVFQRISSIYWPQVPAFVTSHILIWLADKFRNYHDLRSSSFDQISLSPMKFLPFVKLSSFVISQLTEFESSQAYLIRHRLNFQVELLFLYFSTFPLAILFLSLVRCLVVVSANVLYICCARSASGAKDLDERRNQSLWRFAPSLTAATLLAVAFSLSRSLALAIASGFYIFRLISFHLTTLSSSNRDGRNRSLQLHVLFLVLVILCSMLNIAPLISWIKNSRPQEFDFMVPASASCFITICSLICIWYFEDFSLKYSKSFGFILHAGAVLVAITGSIRLFFISEIISGLLAITVLHKTIFSISP